MHPTARGLFVTGTDTGVGKTLIAAALMRALRATGARVLGMKPVASGCIVSTDGLRNDDALRLLAEGSEPLPYHWVNPVAFAPAAAPHLAAAECGEPIAAARLRQAYAALRERANWIVVEGVGGWHVPLGDELLVRDLPALFGNAEPLPVILVVGLRLGCLNHALLSAAAIAADGCKLIGWIGTQTDPDMRSVEGNIATLSARLAAPCLGVVPYLLDLEPGVVAGYLNTEVLLSGLADPALMDQSH